MANGYTQVEGLDYRDTFGPIAKLVTIRSVLAIAATKNWSLHQLDVTNAFLHGDLHEEIYIIPPPGYCKQRETRVCHLQKSLYRLKQAYRNWFFKISSVFLAASFRHSHADHSLFTLSRGTSFTLVLVYVDDLLVAGNHLSVISKLKSFLAQTFKIKDLGTLKYFLGLKVAHSPAGIFLKQRNYAFDILIDSGHLGARSAHFPMEQNLKFNDIDGAILLDPSFYHCLVGRLIYLTVTRRTLHFLLLSSVSSCSNLTNHNMMLLSAFFATSNPLRVKASCFLLPTLYKSLPIPTLIGLVVHLPGTLPLVFLANLVTVHLLACQEAIHSFSFFR